MNPLKSGVGYSIVLLVAGIIGVSYYAVVVLTLLRLHNHHPLFFFLPFVILMILFHFLLGMLVWCYVMVVLSDPGSVPPNWKPLPTVAVLTEEEEQDRFFCTLCANGKPPRSHHCSVCQTCVLKMDHHCIWVVNCVGARNYKFFLLFLLYTFAETTLDALVLLPSVIKLFRAHSSSPAHLAVTFLAFLLNIAFALSLLCFVVMHVSLLSTNTTSIEVYGKRKDVRWKYDLGLRNNFQQVFGTKKAFWLLPLFSRQDLENTPALQGLDFPTRPDIEESQVKPVCNKEDFVSQEQMKKLLR